MRQLSSAVLVTVDTHCTSAVVEHNTAITHDRAWDDPQSLLVGGFPLCPRDQIAISIFWRDPSLEHYATWAGDGDSDDQGA